MEYTTRRAGYGEDAHRSHVYSSASDDMYMSTVNRGGGCPTGGNCRVCTGRCKGW